MNKKMYIQSSILTPAVRANLRSGIGYEIRYTKYFNRCRKGGCFHSYPLRQLPGSLSTLQNLWLSTSREECIFLSKPFKNIVQHVGGFLCAFDSQSGKYSVSNRCLLMFPLQDKLTKLSHSTPRACPVLVSPDHVTNRSFICLPALYVTYFIVLISLNVPTDTVIQELLKCYVLQ